jgi:hypothetical protein
MIDFRLVNRLLVDKLHNSETYWIAVIVGTLINGYGQLLVPWFRGAADPFTALALEFRAHPFLTTFSIVLAYAFPLVVGVVSSVITRYRNRRIESVADFPDRKPDPVFRAAHDGSLVEVGTTTLALFTKHQIDNAQAILGESVWSEIAGSKSPGGGQLVFFAPEKKQYIVSYAPTGKDQFNVYMSELPNSGAHPE